MIRLFPSIISSSNSFDHCRSATFNLYCCFWCHFAVFFSLVPIKTLASEAFDTPFRCSDVPYMLANLIFFRLVYLWAHAASAASLFCCWSTKRNAKKTKNWPKNRYNGNKSGHKWDENRQWIGEKNSGIFFRLCWRVHFYFGFMCAYGHLLDGHSCEINKMYT